MMNTPYSEYISDLHEGLFLGSWHATKSNILNHYAIDSILHIGFEPDSFLESKTYKKVMIDDNPQSTNLLFNEILPPLLKWIHKELSDGKHVLICCSAGRSRSVSIAIAYLLTNRNMKYNEAIDFVKERRPVANPNYGFLEALRSFAIH